MRLDDGDVAALRRWAADDRRAARNGSLATLALPPYHWIVAELDLHVRWDLFWAWMIAVGVGVFLYAYVVQGLGSLLAPGPGTPARVLAGAEPTIVLEGVSLGVVGEAPYAITARIASPPSSSESFLHLSAEIDLPEGSRVVIVGWGGRRSRFRHGTLVETETGRRHWRRDVQWSGCPRHVVPTVD